MRSCQIIHPKIMMENKLVQRFINEVNEVISSEQERDALFEALKSYQVASDVGSLIHDLRQVLNEPNKLEIYEYVRPLVRPQHQQQYDKMAPSAPGQKPRVIRLRRRQNESLGFAVRGGFEHNIGVFVSHVEPGSQAEHHGLKVGDEIVRVNGFTISEAIHEEVLNLIKGKDEIELKVTNIGMIPVKQNPNDPVTWQYVDKTGNTRNQVQAPGNQAVAPVEEVKIFINARGATSLGCTIMSGPKTFPGVFIETVKPGGLAEDYGLGVGDQIMEVNGKSFTDIKHEEAIVELKGSKELNMVIRKGAALPLLNAQKQRMGAGASPQPQRHQTAKNQPGSSYREQERSPEILENIEAEERRLWEEEEARMKRQREEERVRAQFRQKELERQAELERKKKEEERRKNEEAKQKQLAEEKRRQEEREREEQRKREEEMERKREEMERRIEKERQKRREEEEKKRKSEILQQKQESAVLAGRAAPVNSMKPALLGAADTSPKVPTGSGKTKTVKEVLLYKEPDVPLDIDIEGGTDSPLGGKIVVSEVYPDGLADRDGGIKKGDQILKVNDKSLEDVTLKKAQEILWNAEQDSQETIKLVVAESDFRGLDEVTYF